MKTLALIKRRADLTRKEFRDHYEDIHAPLAISSVLEGTTRYVRFHLREEIYGEPAFDVVTAFWYADVQAALGVQQRLETPAGEAVLADELSFMDKSANRFFAVSELPLIGEESPDAPFRALVLARAPEGEAPKVFNPRYEALFLPELESALREPIFYQQHRAEAVGPERPVFDVVTQLQAEADAGLADWAAKLAAEGALVVVVSVEECESPL